MATLAELGDITSDAQYGDLLKKVRVAAVIKAVAIINSTTPAQTALDWAKDAVANPTSAGDGLIYYVIGANESAALSAIYGASDTAIQTNVDAAVDVLYPS